MENLTKRQSVVLDVLDEQITDLEDRLKKAQPMIDELNKLKQTRRTLLSERGTTSGAGHSGPRLTMEEVIVAMRANAETTGAEGMTVEDLSEALGFNTSTVRSHLNRHKDERYEKNGNGLWSLIGEDTDDEDEEDE